MDNNEKAGEQIIDLISMKKEEYDKIRMEKLHQEVQEEFLKRIQKRFIFLTIGIGVLFALVGILGLDKINSRIDSKIDLSIQTLVDESIVPQMKNAETEIKAVQIETLKAKNLSDELTKKSKNNETELLRIKNEAIKELSNIKESAQNTSKEINKIKEDTEQDYADIKAEISNLEKVSKNKKIKYEPSYKNNLLKNNSNYSVLLFFRSKRKYEAELLEEKLLSLGYKSSITQTNLRETKVNHIKNEIIVLYTTKGENILNDISALIKKTQDINSIQVTEKKEQRMRRGDIQILLF